MQMHTSSGPAVQLSPPGSPGGRCMASRGTGQSLKSMHRLLSHIALLPAKTGGGETLAECRVSPFMEYLPIFAVPDGPMTSGEDYGRESPAAGRPGACAWSPLSHVIYKSSACLSRQFDCLKRFRCLCCRGCTLLC